MFPPSYPTSPPPPPPYQMESILVTKELNEAEWTLKMPGSLCGQVHLLESTGSNAGQWLLEPILTHPKELSE